MGLSLISYSKRLLQSCVREMSSRGRLALPSGAAAYDGNQAYIVKRRVQDPQSWGLADICVADVLDLGRQRTLTLARTQFDRIGASEPLQQGGVVQRVALDQRACFLSSPAFRAWIRKENQSGREVLWLRIRSANGFDDSTRDALNEDAAQIRKSGMKLLELGKEAEEVGCIPNNCSVAGIDFCSALTPGLLRALPEPSLAAFVIEGKAGVGVEAISNSLGRLRSSYSNPVRLGIVPRRSFEHPHS